MSRIIPPDPDCKREFDRHRREEVRTAIRNSIVEAGGTYVEPGSNPYLHADAVLYAAIPRDDEHAPFYFEATGDVFCRICSYGWPCPTVRGDQ